MKKGYVYIMGNTQLTLYIGVTSDLAGRIWEHKEKEIPGFTSKYNIDRLLYFETYDSITDAIGREKQLKNWHRQWKLNLIKQENSTFRDLFEDIVGREKMR